MQGYDIMTTINPCFVLFFIFGWADVTLFFVEFFSLSAFALMYCLSYLIYFADCKFYIIYLAALLNLLHINCLVGTHVQI